MKLRGLQYKLLWYCQITRKWLTSKGAEANIGGLGGTLLSEILSEKIGLADARRRLGGIVALTRELTLISTP